MIVMLVCPLYVGNLGCSKMIAMLVGIPSMLEILSAVR